MLPSSLAAVDLNLLRALHALLEEGAVGPAARRLHITPAAASNALRRLREHFGDALLARSGGKLVPTPLAMQLRPLAAAAMNAAALALLPATSFSPATAEGEVRIATSDHVDAIWLGPLRHALARQAPRLTLRVEPYAAHSGQRLLRGDVDLIVAPRARLLPTLRATHFIEEPYCVVTRRSRRTPARGLAPRELCELDHVVVSPSGEPGATAVDRALAALGLRRRVVRQVSGFASALLLVMDSDYAVVLPESFARRYAVRLGLRISPLELEVPPLRLVMAWAPALHQDPAHVFVRGRLLALANRAPPRRATAAA